MGKRGFTLIELIMVILILGILAIVAIPRYFNLQDRAREGAVDGVVGSARSGIHMYYGSARTWPNSLEGDLQGGIDDTTVVYDGILTQGVDQVAAGDVGWQTPVVAGTVTTYTYFFSGDGAADDEVYEYDNDDGSFTLDAAASDHTRP